MSAQVDYGPDNVSTPEDISETNVYEAFEQITEQLEGFIQILESHAEPSMDTDLVIKVLKDILGITESN